VEANGEPAKSVRPIQGVGDLGPPRFALCFLLVTDMWSLMTVPGASVIFRQFARVVGP
jgi:hypothetical protein